MKPKKRRPRYGLDALKTIQETSFEGLMNNQRFRTNINTPRITAEYRYMAPKDERRGGDKLKTTIRIDDADITLIAVLSLTITGSIGTLTRE